MQQPGGRGKLLPPRWSAGVRPGNSYILRLRYWNSTDRGIGSMWSTLQFHVALLTQNDWNEAAWLGSEKLNRYRVDFNAPADAAAVHVYVCGLGYSRITLNGRKHIRFVGGSFDVLLELAERQPS